MDVFLADIFVVSISGVFAQDSPLSIVDNEREVWTWPAEECVRLLLRGFFRLQLFFCQ